MNLLVATIKPWNISAFAKYSPSLEGHWHLVQSPDELANAVARLHPRYIFFPHWSWKVPTAILDAAECVCFHMTDVPYGRGGSPLQNLIVRGHTQTQVSALRMADALDAGPVYLKKTLPLDGPAWRIYQRLAETTWGMIAQIMKTRPSPVPQTGEPVIFPRRTPAQSLLPETLDSAMLYDHIRMLDAPSYPQAFLEHGPWRLEFSQAQFENGELTAKVSFIRQDASK